MLGAGWSLRAPALTAGCMPTPPMGGRGKEEQAKETFAAALEACGDEVDENTDVVQAGLRRYEVLSALLKRYGAGGSGAQA